MVGVGIETLLACCLHCCERGAVVGAGRSLAMSDIILCLFIAFAYGVGYVVGWRASSYWRRDKQYQSEGESG